MTADIYCSYLSVSIGPIGYSQNTKRCLYNKMSNPGMNGCKWSSIMVFAVGKGLRQAAVDLLVVNQTLLIMAS